MKPNAAWETVRACADSTVRLGATLTTNTIWLRSAAYPVVGPRRRPRWLVRSPAEPAGTAAPDGWTHARLVCRLDLVGFTRMFFAKHTLLNILTRYCVSDADRKLLVMRPYQMAATEQILRRIETATNTRRLGTRAAGGYVWHTTGSGKTLTSFKTAQLATKLPTIDKVLFVVDRKDLDHQTMREYERFEKGAANANKSTRVLKRQLEDPGARIIVTTIQKLARYIGQNPKHEICSGHVVIVFDECHCSQFGDMYTAITRAFRTYHLFGLGIAPEGRHRWRMP